MAGTCEEEFQRIFESLNKIYQRGNDYTGWFTPHEAEVIEHMSLKGGVIIQCLDGANEEGKIQIRLQIDGDAETFWRHFTLISSLSLT